MMLARARVAFPFLLAAQFFLFIGRHSDVCSKPLPHCQAPGAYKGPVLCLPDRSAWADSSRPNLFDPPSRRGRAAA